MSLSSSKTYAKLTEKLRENEQKKRVSLRNIEESNYLVAVTRERYNESTDEVIDALLALQKAEQVLKEAQEEQKRTFEESEQAQKRSRKDKLNYSKVVDEHFDIKWKMDALEVEDKVRTIEKQNHDEKRVVLKEKKKSKNPNYFSEKVLKRLSTMPDDIKRLVCEFMPFNVRVSLLNDKFTSIVTHYHSKKTVPDALMLTAFLDYIATQPEFLGLLPRKEARHQIPSLTPRGFKWRHYSCCGIEKPNLKLVYNKILWATEMAKVGNPEFAHKIMKTIVVFGSVPGKYKLSSTVSAKNYLTLEDLPTEYR
jgi:hypothetical protein